MTSPLGKLIVCYFVTSPLEKLIVRYFVTSPFEKLVVCYFVTSPFENLLKSWLSTKYYRVRAFHNWKEQTVKSKTWSLNYFCTYKQTPNSLNYSKDNKLVINNKLLDVWLNERNSKIKKPDYNKTIGCNQDKHGYHTHARTHTHTHTHTHTCLTLTNCLQTVLSILQITKITFACMIAKLHDQA